MRKHIVDEKTGTSYTWQGDCYLPDLSLPIEEEKSVDIWGQRHFQYIKQHKQLFYTALVRAVLRVFSIKSY